MRLGTMVEDGSLVVVAVDSGRVRAIEGSMSLKQVIEAWDPRSGVAGLPKPVATTGRSVDDVDWAPPIVHPGAIYTIGANYRPAHAAADDTRGHRPERPMVLAKVPTSVVGNGTTVALDRALAADVDGECELGVVIGRDASVFGYTIINDMNAVDPRFDGEHWLLGKSMRGFCPLGPWIVTADELDPADLRIGSSIGGRPIQDGRTSQMRFSIAEVIDYIDRHVGLRPGDLIATGTPPRLTSDPGPGRHLRAGDIMTCWIEGIGELTTTIAEQRSVP